MRRYIACDKVRVLGRAITQGHLVAESPPRLVDDSRTVGTNRPPVLVMDRRLRWGFLNVVRWSVPYPAQDRVAFLDVLPNR